MKIVIQQTADGSPTLYREDIDEHYHSVKGALAESLHVYVNAGWRMGSEISRPVKVFEVGFGTGLNAALTAKATLDAGISTEYYSVELYPLETATTDIIANAIPEEYRNDFVDVNHSPWDEKVMINPCFSLYKRNDSLLTMSLPEDLDVVYFDAFAPEKQPEMWDESIFRKLYAAMRPGGIMVTYCAKGCIRRMLQEIGFITERLPGPPAGKREILRASVPHYLL